MNEISLQKLREFFSKYKTVTYKRRQVILRPGETPDYVGFIKSGFVRVYTINKDCEETTIQTFRPMLFFTYLFYKTGVKNKYYFEAIDDVELWTAPAAEVNEYFKANPDIASSIMKDFFEKFLLMSEQLSRGLSGKAPAKVAGAILSLTKLIEGESRIFSITHKLIASMTGMTRETATLQMLKMKKEKLIDNSNRRIIILNIKRLEDIAGNGTTYIDEG